jgi:hypothetical protein
MRASCVIDWTERYPSHVVYRWAGHTEAGYKALSPDYARTLPEGYQPTIANGRSGAATIRSGS